jgi:mersacidin/lichenicidin family type 2 lantibiotic
MSPVCSGRRTLIEEERRSRRPKGKIGGIIMNKVDLIRAWKDPVYRARLSREEIAGLPDHPSGLLELDEGLLKEVAGAATLTTYKTCTAYTSNQARGCCK